MDETRDPNTYVPTDAGSLDGRVAIVTGAGSRGDGIGNGRAAAILLARRGARILLIDRNRQWAERTRAMIAAEGGLAQVVECDVREDEACRLAVAAALRAWGRVDILVNNVGIGDPAGTAVDVDLQAWDEGLRVNVTSMMLMARHAIPAMRRAGGGAIVNIASVAGLKPAPMIGMYGASKSAVIHVTQELSLELAPAVRVNAVAPAVVKTRFANALYEGREEEVASAYPMKRLGLPEDIAGVTTFLLSEDAAWVTGQCLTVDGGLTLTGGV